MERSGVAVQSPQQPDKLLRMSEVEELVGLRKSAIYDRVSRNLFPAPRSTYGNRVAWRSSDIQRWIAELPEVESRTAA